MAQTPAADRPHSASPAATQQPAGILEAQAEKLAAEGVSMFMDWLSALGGARERGVIIPTHTHTHTHTRTHTHIHTRR